MNNFKKISFSWILWFLVCLFPFSYKGLTANYLYALTPMIFIFSGYSVRPIPKIVKIILFLSFFIFFISSILEVYLADYFLRRVASFLIFLFLFSWSFFDLPEQIVSSFLASVVVIGFILGVSALAGYFMGGGAALGFGAKGEVGTQRTGFLYLFGFWIIAFSAIYFFKQRQLILGCASACSLILFVLFLFLTFSRASIFGLAGGVCFYVVIEILLKGSLRQRIVSVGIFGFISLAVFIVFSRFPLLLHFFDQRFFSLVVAQQIDGGTESRILWWVASWNYVLNHPFYGSGFLGSWAIGIVGSMHSQYFDLLLRLGFPGFLVFMLLWFKVSVFLFREHRSLFYGMIGMIFFGVFHETIKLSQAGVIFAFCLSLWCSRQRLVSRFNRKL